MALSATDEKIAEFSSGVKLDSKSLLNQSANCACALFGAGFQSTKRRAARRVLS